DVIPEGYRVDLNLNPDQDQFSGSVRIQLKVNRPTPVIWLNANQLTVQEAVITSAAKTLPAKAEAEGNDFLALRFDTPVPAGPAEILIRYSGKVRTGSSGIFRADDSGNRYLLTQFESTDARDAFPCFDEPAYKVPWQLTLHIPAQLAAVSNTPVA